MNTNIIKKLTKKLQNINIIIHDTTLMYIICNQLIPVLLQFIHV